MTNQETQSSSGYYVDKLGFAYVASPHIAGRAEELGLTFVPAISGPQITAQLDVEHLNKYHFSVQFPGDTVWDFGDGESEKTKELTVSHDYAVPGTYKVRAIQKSGSSGVEVIVAEPTVVESLDPPPPVEDNIIPPQGKPRTLTKAEKAKMKAEAEESTKAFEEHEARLAAQAAADAEAEDAEILAAIDKAE